jgi:porphobilinogen synthase
MVRTSRLSVDQLVAPVFIREDITEPTPITALAGHHQWPVDSVDHYVDELANLHIPAILLFGIPATKGSHPISLQAIERLRAKFPDLVLIADCCLCSTTPHGHCGVVHNGRVDNDATNLLIAQQAVAYANAGIDLVAPSGMMDGQVHAIRQALDAAHHTDVGIWSYSVKMASAFYGPFREATHCSPAFGDRRTYQVDPGNGRHALLEASLDVQEGADILMVKPAGPYLDLIYQLKQAHPDLPLGAYQVSGEYALLQSAPFDLALESLTGIHRAGADLIITYYAAALARQL